MLTSSLPPSPTRRTPIRVTQSNNTVKTVSPKKRSRVSNSPSRAASESEVLQSVHTSDATGSEESRSRGHGRLELIIGPMFSGKTTELLRQIEQNERVGAVVLAVKSEIDTRHATATSQHRSAIVSHSGGQKECIALQRLSQLQKLFADEYKSAEIIAIDEAQFFPDLATFCQKAVDEDCKTVYAAGLDGDFRRQPFRLQANQPSSIMQTIPLADSVSKLNATCYYCKKPAPFTFRTVQDQSEVLVGGLDSYVPVCRAHYLLKRKEHQSDDEGSEPQSSTSPS